MPPPAPPIEAASPQDERHARHGLRLRGLEAAWVRRCTALHFVQSGVVTTTATRATVAEGSLASSEGDRRWSRGLLFDNHTEVAPRTDRVVFLGNRGDHGTGHGWSTVNSVAWRVDPAGKEVVVQQPPTAQNWAIGCLAAVTGKGPFPGSRGSGRGHRSPGRRTALPV